MFIIQKIINRTQLLGIEFVPLLFLLADTLLLLNITSFVLGRVKFENRSPAETFLAGGLIFLGCVISTVTLLGAIGFLSWANLFFFHLLIWLSLPFLRGLENYRQAIQENWQSFVELIETICLPIIGIFRLKNWGKGKDLEQALLALLVIMLTSFAILAVFTLPLNYDSNTYRLSRIAYWLQENNICHFVTNDERQNYMAQNVDLIMLWLTSFFKSGFPLVHLTQFLGGLLSCAAVYEMSRTFGFPRLWRLSAIIALIGIPNVAIQFFTSQTDLFTTGCLAAGLVFLLAALRNHRLRDWFLFGVGLGLAVGAKGTVFYWGPGLLFLFVCWACIHRTPGKKVVKGTVLATSLMLLLAGFNYAQNLARYDNPFAPADSVHEAHSSLTTSRLHYTFVNGCAYLWQIFEPNSNLPILRPLTDSVLGHLQSFLLALENPHFKGFLQRFQSATRWIPSYGLNEDFASFGFLVFFLGIIGGLLSIVFSFKSRQNDTIGIAAILASTLLFLVVFCSLQSWTIHKYRYFVLLGPFISVLSIFAIMNFRMSGQNILLILFLSSQFFMAGHVAFHSRTHGLWAMMRPQSVPNYVLWNETISLIKKLGDKSLKVSIALQQNSWLAPYFRSPAQHHITFVPLSELSEYQDVEAFLRANKYDFLITDPKIIGHFGRVRSYTSARWSRIAFRILNIDEIANPVITGMKGLFSDGWTSLTASIGLTNSLGGNFSLKLWNPTPFERQIVLKSSIEKKYLTLKPGGSESFPIKVSETDIVTIHVSPAFVPAETVPNSPDRRTLGVRLELPENAFN